MVKTKNKLKKTYSPVSAVIAAHNEELHIAKCLESLLAQSYPNLEILVVENGESRDKTLEIAKKYAQNNKNIKVFSIPGKQKGPGNAWNYGVKIAKGEIIIVCGADLIYGADYVTNGVTFLKKNKKSAIIHKEEKCNNLHNFWARAFFKIRLSTDETGKSKIFTIALRNFLIKNPFNSELGYADDQTIFRKKGTRFEAYELEVYHTNPASFKDTWEHSVWVGKSMSSPIKIISILPFFLFYAIYKTLKHLLTEDFYLPFIFFLPIYYSIRYFAYFKEAVKKL